MTLEYSQNPRQSWTYKFTPPMQAGQARVRLEAMHREAKEGLGISEVQVNYLSLSGSAWISVALCLALNLWLLLTPSPSIAHTLRWQAPIIRPILSLLSLAPTPENVGDAIKAFWCGSLGLAHFVEIFACLNPLLRRYNVKHPLTRFLYVSRIPQRDRSRTSTEHLVPRQMLFCQIGGFPVWQSLRDEGIKLESKDAKKH